MTKNSATGLNFKRSGSSKSPARASPALRCGGPSLSSLGILETRTSREPTLAFEIMKTETCIALFALACSALIGLWAIGGLDDGDVRVLEDSTPAGVHGKLKGE